MRAGGVLKVVVVSVAALVAILVLAVYVLLETRWGMERVRRFGLDFVNERIPGTVSIARVAGPGLLGGIRIYDVTVRDPEGRIVLTTDSARVSYDWRSFIRRRPVLDDVYLFAPDVRVVKELGEESFGIARAFVSEEPGDTIAQGEGMPLEAHDVRIVGGTLLVRQPVEDEAATDSRFVLEQVPGGTVRSFRFDGIVARLGRVLVGGPDTRVAVDIDAATVEGRVLQNPFVMERASGRVVLRDSTVVLDMPVVELPDSRTAVRGEIVLGHDWTGFDLEVDAADVALRDLRWVDERVPDRGTFAGHLAVTTVDGRLRIDGNDLRLAIDGTRITGRAGMSVADDLRLRNVDLSLQPLELQLLEPYLEQELPFEGVIEGRIAADGPLTGVMTRADLRIRPRGAATPARLRWSGVAGATGDPVLRDVDVQIDDLDASVVGAFLGDVDVQGSIDASLLANGPLARGVTIDGTLSHRLPGNLTSILQARGSVMYASDEAILDLELMLQPFRLEALAPFSPSLASARGAANGSVRVTGPVSNLAVRAEVSSPGGMVRANVRVSEEAGRRLVGEAMLSRFRPSAVIADLPDAGASGTIRFDLAGTEIASLRGNIDATLDSASFQRFALGRLRLDARVADGVLQLDTLTAIAPGSSLSAVGTLGLDEEHSGSLAARLVVSTLQPLEDYVFEEESEDPTVARIDGSGEANIRLHGSITSLAMEADAQLETLRWQDENMYGLSIRANGSGIASDSTRLDFLAVIDSAAAIGHTVDTAFVSGSLVGGEFSVEAYAGLEGRDRAHVEALVRRNDAGAIETRLSSLRLGDGPNAWVLSQPALVRIDGPTVAIDSLSLERANGAGRFAAQGQITRISEEGGPSSTPLDFTATLEQVPLGELIAVAGVTADVRGNVGGNFRLTGTPQAPAMEGSIAVRDFALDDAVLDSLAARVDYADQRMEIATQAFGGGRRVFFGEGRVPVDLRLGATTERRLAEELDFSFQADSMPARFLLGFVDAVNDVDGVLDGQVSASGTTREPQLNGAFALRRGAATLPVLGVRYRNVVGTFLFERDMVVRMDISARATPANDPNDIQGAFRVLGDLDLDDPTNPGINFNIEAQDLLAARRRDVDLHATGIVYFDDYYASPRLSGEIRVNGDLNVDELYRRTQIIALEDPLLLDVVDTSLVSVKRVLPQSENPFLSNLRIQDFTATVEQGTRLRSREMNVEVTGELNVIFDRQAEDLRLTGTLQTVRGTYRLELGPIAKVFDVLEGTVTFPGTPGVNPNLSLQALNRVRTPRAEAIDVLAVISGTLENPRVTLRSDTDPNISQSDLASYLFIGMPSYAIGAGGGSGSPFAAEAGTSLGLSYIGSGLQSLVQGTGLLDYIGVTAAETTGGPQQSGFGGVIQNTQIELGRYITPELFVVWTQRLGNETGTGTDIRLEWRITRTYRADIYWEDRFARAPSFGLRQIASARKVFGFLLYREWGY